MNYLWIIIILVLHQDLAFSGPTNDLPHYLEKITQTLPEWANPKGLHFKQQLIEGSSQNEMSECLKIKGKNIFLYKHCSHNDQVAVAKELITLVFNHSLSKIKRILLDLTNGEELAQINYFEIPGVFEFLSSMKPEQELLTTFHREALLFKLFSVQSGQHPYLLNYLETLDELSSSKGNGGKEVDVPEEMKEIAEKEALTDYRYLRDPIESLRSRVKIIKEAKTRIWMSYYIWSSDSIGTYFIGLIAKKLKENPQLDVRILIDGKGWNSGESTPIADKKRLFQYLVKLGAKVKIYNPYFNLFKINPEAKAGADGFKHKKLANIIGCNHDKITLVDNDLMIIGGRNIAKEYYLTEEEIINNNEYGYYDSDILLRSQGLSRRVETAFLSEFTSRVANNLKTHHSKKIDEESRKAISLAHSLVEVDVPAGEIEWDELGVPGKIVDKNSLLGEDQSFPKMILTEITKAKKEILIQNPYVVLTDELYSALYTAGKKEGMYIVLHLPFHDAISFKTLQNYVEQNFEKILHEIPGIEIFARRGPVQLHSKIMVFDRQKTLISSFNLDPLSFYYNSEIGVIINSPVLGQRVAQEIIDDINAPEKSVYYDLEGPEYLSQRDKQLRKEVKSQGILYWLIKDYL